MALDKFKLIPNVAGYTVTPPTQVVQQELDGGAGNYSLEVDGGTSTVDAQFTVDLQSYQYAEAFFRNRAGRGAEPFLIDLMIAGDGLTEYTAYLKPPGLKLTGKDGDMRMFACQFEVYPQDVDDDYDSSVVDVFEASDGDMVTYLNLLAALVAALP